MCCRRERCWDDILSCGVLYPAAVLEGRSFPLTRVQDVARAEHALNRPGVLGPPSGLPVISHAIPKFTPTRSTGAVGPEGLGGIKGMTLPRQAERPLTPFMRQQIRVHRQLQGPPRIETRPEFRPLARPETAPQVEVIRGVTSQKFHPSGSGGFQPAPGATTPEVIRGGTSRRFHPPGSGDFNLHHPGNSVSRPEEGSGRCHPGYFANPPGFAPLCRGNSRPPRLQFSGQNPGPRLEPEPLARRREDQRQPGRFLRHSAGDERAALFPPPYASGRMSGNEAYPPANSNPAALTTRSRSGRGMGAAHS